MKKPAVAVNAAINVLRQCCAVLFPLLITRHVTSALGAENYGRVAFGNSLVEYFSMAAALGINAYGVREGAKVRCQPDALKGLCRGLFTVNLLATVLSYAALGALLCLPRLRDYRQLIAIQSAVILFNTLGADWINNIFEDFRYIALRQIAFQLLGLGATMLLVRTGADTLRYARILALTRIGGNVLNIFYVRRNYVTLGLTRKLQLGRHLKPLLLLLGSTLAGTLAVHLGTTLLALLDSDEAAGIYGLCVKVYTIVRQLIYAVVCAVLPRLAAHLGAGEEGHYQKLSGQLLHGLLLLLLPAAVGLGMLSPQAIDLLGGSAYLEGAAALRILAAALLFGAVGYFVLYAVLIPRGLERASLIAPVAGAAVGGAASMTLIPALGIRGAAVGLLTAELAALLLLLRSSRGRWQFQLDRGLLLAGMAGCIAVGAVCAWAQGQFHSAPAILAAAIPGSVVLYTLALLPALRHRL